MEKNGIEQLLRAEDEAARIVQQARESQPHTNTHFRHRRTTPPSSDATSRIQARLVSHGGALRGACCSKGGHLQARVRLSTGARRLGRGG